MDPNLTLAHITHNTSMILLHYPIAFPPKGWKDYVALPKDCSAQTCELAAIETSNIVDKFLAHTPIPFVNVQFSFCAFVAAKALLYNHQATRRPLRAEFHQLVRNLWEMSTRWKGKLPHELPLTSSINQAGKYAQHLEHLWQACQQDPQFRFDLYDHSCKIAEPYEYVSPASITTPSANTKSTQPDQSFVPPHVRQNSANSSQPAASPRGRLPSSSVPFGAPLASPALPGQNGFGHHSTALSPNTITPQYAVQQSQGIENHGQHGYHMGAGSLPTPTSAIPHPHQQLNGAPNQSLQDQSLLTLSDTLMDAQFLDMDRVITFEDANFFMPGDFRWQ